MVIDFHTHVFPDKIAQKTVSALANSSNNKPFSDGTVNGILNAMQNAGVDVCVNLPVLTKPEQFDSVTKFAVSINEQFASENRRIIAFGGMHPLCDDIDGKMAYLKSLGIKGIKIHPDYQGTFIDDDKYIQILFSAKKYDMIVVTHSGVDDGYKDFPIRCTPDRVLKVIKEVNHDKFVLAHYGAHKQWQEVLDKLAGENVYFDTAFSLHEIDKETFISILNKHGVDKILFATDNPWRDFKEDLSILKSYALDKQTEDKILYKNAVKLLGI